MLTLDDIRLPDTFRGQIISSAGIKILTGETPLVRADEDGNLELYQGLDTGWRKLNTMLDRGLLPSIRRNLRAPAKAARLPLSPGRKPMADEDRRDEALGLVRLSGAEHAALLAAAEAAGQPLATWARETLLAAAKR